MSMSSAASKRLCASASPTSSTCRRALSQGQRRRVGLARLFLSANRLLWVLDEPFTALDVRAVADLAATLSAHCDAGGMVMLTTHQDAPFARPPDVLDVGVFAC